MLYYGFENSMKIYFLLIQILIIKKNTRLMLDIAYMFIMNIIIII